MAYQALYRKYRLSTFDDMVGQEHISSTIKNAIASKKISHAYLFTGPRGTGKTSIAKLIARAVNCVGDTVLCGVCETCVDIMKNEVSDIIEIDAASNNGVDEIRDIRDKVKYAPSVCKYKVYIIDETHMLTTQAFNALLKTLEDPPSHVIFILATTEPHKIPLTILSRCQRFDFRKISENAIIERLNYVIKNESIKIETDAVKLIAYLSDGGMRDALSLLDQVSSYITEEITTQDVYNVTGTASKIAVEDIIKSVFSKNKVSLLKEVGRLNNQGKDLVKLCDSVIVYMRDAMVSANGISENLIYSDSETFNKISKLTIEELYKYITYLTDVLYKIKTVHNPKIFLEVSLLNLVELVEKPLEFSDMKNYEEMEPKEEIAKDIKENKEEPGINNKDDVIDVVVESKEIDEENLTIALEEVTDVKEEITQDAVVEEVESVEEEVQDTVVEEAKNVEEEVQDTKEDNNQSSEKEVVKKIDVVEALSNTGGFDNSILFDNTECEKVVDEVPSNDESNTIVEVQENQQSDKESVKVIEEIVDEKSDNVELDNEDDDEEIEEILIDDQEDDQEDLSQTLEGEISEEEKQTLEEIKSVEDIFLRGTVSSEIIGEEEDDDEPIFDEFEDVEEENQVTPPNFVEEEMIAGEEIEIEDNSNVITSEMEKKYYNFLRGVRINNTLYGARKDTLIHFNTRWEKIETYNDVDYSHIITVLRTCNLRATDGMCVMISVPTEMVVVKIMSNIKEVEEVVSKILDMDIKVSALTESEWSRVREDYINKIKMGKDYDLMEEQTINEFYQLEDNREVLIEKAKEYFGDENLEVEE